MAEPRLLPLGEEAWLLAFGDRVDPALHRRVTAVAAAIEAAALPGVRDVVPAYTTIGVYFDALNTDAAALGRELLELVAATPDSAGRTDSRLVEIPVRYDGPDLDEVASRLGLTAEDVARRHAAREYRVYLLGFAPGFAYLGELDPSLELPRRDAPRTAVPAGSVAIAGLQTAVYPLRTPGGWHLIGSTTLRLYDPAREPPVLLRAGDRVRFVPVPA